LVEGVCKKTAPPAIKPSWGIKRQPHLETGSTIYYGCGRIKGFNHIKQFRAILRIRQSRDVLAFSRQTKDCLAFILESERRKFKRDACKRLFCNRPEYSLEVMAFTLQGDRINLLSIGFCIAEKNWNHNHFIARTITDFAAKQLEQTEWEYTQFFDQEGTGSKLLLMSALLSSYCSLLQDSR
jgi:hypothetical protein